MKNRKSKVWSITAGILFGIVIAATIGLIVMIEQLNMIPVKYLIIAGLAVVFVWTIIFLCLFGWPFSFKKNPDKIADKVIKQIVKEIAKGIKKGRERAIRIRNRIIRSFFRTIGVTLALVLLATDVMGMSVIYKLQTTLSNMVQEEPEEEAQGEEEKPFVITEDPFVVYISGNDTKSSMEKVRSDVNILAVVNPSTKQVLLVNTPRDYYVKISESKRGERDKLTHCGIYGMDCSIETLNNLYDIEIDYYAQLNFRGFIRMIDAVGGIEVYSEKSFTSWSEHMYFKKGTNHLDGEEALEFVRERHAFGDGDAARGRHQMEVVQGLIKKFQSGALLTNYGEILDNIGKYFRCDFSQTEISDLVKMQLSDFASWDVKTFAVTGEGTSRYTYSIPNAKAYVMIPDEDSVDYAHELMDKVFAGEELTEEDLVYTPEKEKESTSTERE